MHTVRFDFVLCILLLQNRFFTAWYDFHNIQLCTLQNQWGQIDVTGKHRADEKTRPEVEVKDKKFDFLLLSIVAATGINKVHNFPTNLSTASQRETEGWPPAARLPLLQAVSCIGSSALKETQGRLEDSDLHRGFIFVSLPPLKSSFF